MKKNEAFLKAFNEIGSAVLEDDGIFNNLVFDYAEDGSDWYGEGIRAGIIGEELSTEVVRNAGHYVKKETILKVSDRYFRVTFTGIGKDLDEYGDYSIVEVIPKEITTTIYVSK